MILPILGIDITKLKFNVCLLDTKGKLKHKVFPNTAAGFQQLTMWLVKQGTQARTRLHGSNWCIRQGARLAPPPSRAHSQRRQSGGHHVVRRQLSVAD